MPVAQILTTFAIGTVSVLINRQCSIMGNKPVNLRAFSVSLLGEFLSEQPSITSQLKNVLTETSIVQDRTMKLNEEENEEDVLSFFQWDKDKKTLFGLILRVLKNDISQGIPSELYSKPSFSIADIDGTEGIDTCKDFYYVLLNDDFLVTNLKGNLSINRAEAYFNYLLREQRKVVYKFVQVMTIPDEIQLSEIKKITIADDISLQTETESVGTIMKTLSDVALSHLMGEKPGLEEIMKDEIIQAELLIKFRKRPKDMSREDYEGFIGRVVHPLSIDSGILIETKQGKKIFGEKIKREKCITIDTTETGRYNEKNLMQEMESFVIELARE